MHRSVLKLQQNVSVKQSERETQENVHGQNHAMLEMRRCRIEAAASFIRAVVNAITVGVDGRLEQGLEKLLAGIVDFGDPVHMLEMISSCLGKSEELGNASMASIKEQFELGVQLATLEAEDVLLDAVEEGNAVVADAVIATLAHGEFNHSQEV